MSEGLPQDPGVPQPPARPAPPSFELRRAGDTQLVEYLARRVETLQREMEEAQRRALDAHGLLRQQEALRVEVEAQLKTLSEQMRRERSEKDLEEDRTRARGRVDALEKRLDEMHQTWAALLKDAIGARDAGSETAASELRSVRAEVAALRDAIGSLPRLLPEMQDLRARIPSEEAREDQARRLEGLLAAKLDDLDRRLALEMEKHRDRAAALSRERSAVEEALQEQRAQIQQEYLKERVALQAQFNEQAAELRKMAGALQSGKEGETEQVRVLKGMVDRLHELLTQPPHAKDEIVRELEQEKRDLMTALKERNHQLQQNTMERREVERSLGESLIKLNRQLEDERAKQQAHETHAATLEHQIRALEAKLELARKEGDDKDQRYLTLAAERDELAKALMAEAEKVRAQIAGRVDSEQGWEARVQQATQAASEERSKRIAAEGALGDLRAQQQTLSEHLSRALQEKDLAAHQTSAWRQEKEQLQAVLRKKDEMIAMLSSTFQGLIRPK